MKKKISNRSVLKGFEANNSTSQIAIIFLEILARPETKNDIQPRTKQKFIFFVKGTDIHQKNRAQLLVGGS